MSETRFIGKLKQIYRYPLKSAVGENTDATTIGKNGVWADRIWALYDLKKEEITGGRKIPKILTLRSKLMASSKASNQLDIEIKFPDGSIKLSSDPDVSECLSSYLDKSVKLFPILDKSNKKHYSIAKKNNSAQLRRLLGLNPNDELPDFGEWPLKMLLDKSKYTTIPGTYFDCDSLHIVSTSSIDTMKKYDPQNEFEIERFRPNLYIETIPELEGFVEQGWIGHDLKIGETTINCSSPTPRCSIPGASQYGLESNRKVSRSVYRFAQQKIGIYAKCPIDGEINIGDEVYLIKRNKNLLERQFSNFMKNVKSYVVKKTMG